ncbi:MAG TPA: DUF3455 domain-containing protein [Polyangiaceae bacterium]|nr:DUF3455 domain-containing protein [Polyangiaceae bacterium]
MHQKIVLSTVAVGALLLGACGSVTPESPEAVSTEADTLKAADVCPAGVPAALAPAADQTIKGKYDAVGVQVYMCNGLAAGPAWTFVAPQANLMKDNGKFVATHFIGPTWQGNDGSSVVGAKAASATVDATAVPWLLLTATSHATDDGFFEDVTSIQRLATVGGIAPATGCDASHLGAIGQVPYSAEYVFYKTKSKGNVQQCAGN